MTQKHLTAPYVPNQLEPEQAGNGATPRSSFLRRAADAMNSIATSQKKVLTVKCQNIQQLDGGDAVQRTPWPFYFRSGENTTGLQIQMGMVDTDLGAAVSPNVVVTVYLASTGASVVTQTFYYNGRNAPLNHWEIANRTNLISMKLEGLSSNTEYYVTILVNDGARVLYLSAWERADRHADDSVVGVVDPSKFLDEGPIYDEHVQDLLHAGARHWRHSACHYLSWSHDWGTPNTVSAASYTNVMDGSSTTHSANTPGATIASQYHGTAFTSAAGPAVKIAVKATRTAGAGSLSVRLYDGTNVIELTGVTTGGVGDWYTGVANIPSQVAKWDVQAKVTAGTFQIDAVCVFAYDDGSAEGADAVTDWALPATSTEWAEVFPSITVPTAMWPMQDTALPLVDTIGTFDLADVNTNGAETCLSAGDPLGRYAVHFAEIDSGVALASTSDLEVNTSDFTVFFRFMVPVSATPSSTYHFFRKRYTGALNGWSVRYNSSAADMRLDFTINPGAGFVSAVVSGDHADGEWRYCMAVIDRTAAEIRLYTDLGTTTTSIAAFGGDALATPYSFGYADAYGVGNSGAVSYCSYATAWLGTALTQDDFDRMRNA